ncbi:MAG: transposase [Vicinamibacterales bacterium]
MIEAVKFFSVPQNCLEYLVARRWPDGVTCPACGSEGVYFDKSRMGWICKSSIRSGSSRSRPELSLRIRRSAWTSGCRACG